jgi:hypothetical protein
MVSQVLLGESVTRLAVDGKWTLVRCNWDSYEGWTEAIHFRSLDGAFEPSHGETCSIPNLDRHCHGIVTGDFAVVLDNSNQEKLVLSAGCILWKALFPEGIELLRGQLSNKRVGLYPSSSDYLIEMSLSWQGTPYLWGGRSRFGVDCSGFMQILWQSVGILLPRDAKDQFSAVTKIPVLERSQAFSKGNLAFFGTNKDKITHVGLLLSDNQLIHSSGKVQTDYLDSNGIFLAASKREYSHQLIGIGKVTQNSNLETIE